MRALRKNKHSVFVSLPSEKTLGLESAKYGPEGLAGLYGDLGPTAGGLDRDDLELVRDVLNGLQFQELQPELRRLFELWQLSGPSLTSMVKASESGLSLWEAVNRSLKLTWMPTESGNARLIFGMEPLKGGPFSQYGRVAINKSKATVLFALLTLNPEWNKLAGPCHRCGDYYIKRRASQKVYCSRRCGNAATAVARTRERIADERRDKIARAKAAMKRWKPTENRQDWKHWVAEKTGIDPRFLTRAVTKGDLVAPEQEK